MPNDVHILQRTPFVEELLQPISAANPCGEDVSWDEAFRRVKAQIDEGRAVSTCIDYEKAQGESSGSISGADSHVAFESLIEECRAILKEKAKDLRVACYLALGLLHTQGLPGLADGLVLVHDLTTTYWDELYPPKPRVRKGAFELLISRLGDEMDSYTPALEDREPLEQIRAATEQLQAFLMNALQENAPLLSGLREKLDLLQRRVPQPPEPTPEPEIPEVPAAEEDPEQESALSGDGVATEVPDASIQHQPPQAIDSIEAALKAAEKSADFLYEDDYTNPVAYRLRRLLRWETLHEEPAHEEGVTDIPAPSEAQRTYLLELLAKAQYAPLVEAAEALFCEPSALFWLDSQRLLVAAMDALGQPFAAARSAVLHELDRFLERFPELPTWSFSDNTPFADLETLAWLAERTAATVEEPEPEAPVASTDEVRRPALAQQFAEARAALAREDLAKAIAIMQAGATEDVSFQDHFHRRLYRAVLCVEGGRPDIARPLLEDLHKTVNEHRLDRWDPSLALAVWTRLHACYVTLAAQAEVPQQHTLHERAEHLFEAICRLDIDRALAFKPNPARQPD